MHKKKLNVLLSKIINKEGDWREQEKNIIKFIYMYSELSQEHQCEYLEDSDNRHDLQHIIWAMNDMLKNIIRS